jgi:adenylate cyclase
VSWVSIRGREKRIKNVFLLQSGDISGILNIITYVIMAKEIERQFVVNTEHPLWNEIFPTLHGKRYSQSVLHKSDDYKLRARLIEDLETGEYSAKLTFKIDHKSDEDEPNVRSEYEWDIPSREALYLMIRHKAVVKTRYIYVDGYNQKWEVDIYENENMGVITADIEVNAVDVQIILPEWIGQEVTKEKKISNSYFSGRPFQGWTLDERKWYESLKIRFET